MTEQESSLPSTSCIEYGLEGIVLPAARIALLNDSRRLSFPGLRRLLDSVCTVSITRLRIMPSS